MVIIPPFAPGVRTKGTLSAKDGAPGKGGDGFGPRNGGVEGTEADAISAGAEAHKTKRARTARLKPGP